MRSRRSVGPVPQAFPIRDRYTVSGHVVGDVCFTCRCRVVGLASGDDSLVFAWRDCALPNDFGVMESSASSG